MKNSRKLLSGIFVVFNVYFGENNIFCLVEGVPPLQRVVLRTKFVTKRMIFANWVGNGIICFLNSSVPELTATECRSQPLKFASNPLTVHGGDALQCFFSCRPSVFCVLAAICNCAIVCAKGENL